MDCSYLRAKSISNWYYKGMGLIASPRPDNEWRWSWHLASMRTLIHNAQKEAEGHVWDLDLANICVNIGASRLRGRKENVKDDSSCQSKKALSASKWRSSSCRLGSHPHMSGPSNQKTSPYKHWLYRRSTVLTMVLRKSKLNATRFPGPFTTVYSSPADLTSEAK